MNTKNTRGKVTLNGASAEIINLLESFKVVSAETRRTLGHPAKLYLRLEEIQPPMKLKLA